MAVSIPDGVGSPCRWMSLVGVSSRLGGASRRLMVSFVFRVVLLRLVG